MAKEDYGQLAKEVVEAVGRKRKYHKCYQLYDSVTFCVKR